MPRLWQEGSLGAAKLNSASILGAASIPDEGKPLDANNLNNLDDWQTFHKEVIAG